MYINKMVQIMMAQIKAAEVTSPIPLSDSLKKK